MRGNRRQTNPNRLKNIIIEFIKENIKTYLILTIIFFIGLTLGVIFVNNANETQANQISGYINNFINSIKENYQISTKELLKNCWDSCATVVSGFYCYRISTNICGCWI